MVLQIEVAGHALYGIPPYTIFVICVQQPAQSWSVYRRRSTFKALSEHLATMMTVAPCPLQHCTVEDASTQTAEQLTQACAELQHWLTQVLLQPGAAQTPVMRNFLCAEANLPPPQLNVTYVRQSRASLDEMEMDELFDRHLDEKEDEFDDGEIAEHAEEATQIGTAEGFEMATSLPPPPPPAPPFPPPPSADGEAVPPAETGEAEGDDGCLDRRKQQYSLDSFKTIRVIGKGSFGKVFLVREKTSGHIFAMKVLQKENIIKRNQVEHTRTERSVLGYVKHPFIVGLNMAFQTRDKLFFVLDYCAGGELFFHLGKLGKFPEPRARFYAAEITLALEHVHRLNIIYRDLKPENVLLDARGHVRLTDFGLSKEGINDNVSGAHSFCGTPEYLAPEILNRQGHGRAVDWWSLGALLYEMLTGLPPFYCRDREKLFEKIRSAELSYPRYLSENAKDLLRGLLTRDPNARLGSTPDDADPIKQHPFYSEIEWVKIASADLPPPWEPSVVGSLDTSQFDREFTSMPIFSPDPKDCKLGSLDNTFEGFTFTDHASHLLPGGPAGSSDVASSVVEEGMVFEAADI